MRSLKAHFTSSSEFTGVNGYYAFTFGCKDPLPAVSYFSFLSAFDLLGSFEAAVIFDFDGCFSSHCLIPWMKQKKEKKEPYVLLSLFSFLGESLPAVFLTLIPFTQHGPGSL